MGSGLVKIKHLQRWPHFNSLVFVMGDTVPNKFPAIMYEFDNEGCDKFGIPIKL